MSDLSTGNRRTSGRGPRHLLQQARRQAAGDPDAALQKARPGNGGRDRPDRCLRIEWRPREAAGAPLQVDRVAHVRFGAMNPLTA
jgi:hypothetical protein